MIKAIYTVIKIGIIAALIYWLAGQDGFVSIEWQGWRVDASITVIAFGVIISVGLLYWGSLFYSALRKAPRKFQENRALSRREKGYKALTQGMVAVAAGDKLEALRQSRRANHLLDDPPLTMLLSAQAAQLNGDETAAKKYFTAMQEHPDAAFLGLRGLMTQAVKENDQAKALQLAEQAFALRPDTSWVLDELLKLQTQSENWDAALETIDKAIKNRSFTREEGQKQKSQILHQLARKARDNGDLNFAINQIKKSVKLYPTYSPAITTYARLLQQTGKLRRGEKILEDAWRNIPDANIAYTYKSLVSDISPLDQIKRFERLIKTNPNHEESHFTMARLALDASLWGEVRKHIAPLINGHHLPASLSSTDTEETNNIAASSMEINQHGEIPSARVCRLMAELEEKEHHDLDRANYWLNLAVQEK